MYGESELPVIRSGTPPIESDEGWFTANPERYLRLRHGRGAEPDLLLAFQPHEGGPIYILTVPHGSEPQSWLLDGIQPYADIWLAFPAFEALAGKRLLRAKLVCCLERGGRLDPDWTPEDYRPGSPRHNAQVFLRVWNRTVMGVEDDGLFEVGEGSGGVIEFQDVVDYVRGTDTQHKLSRDDAENTAAMLYHLTPDMQYD